MIPAMKASHKVLLAVVLVALAVVAVVFGVRNRQIPEAPPEVLAVTSRLVDEVTLEVVEMTQAERMKLGTKGGKVKNAKTGNYTLCPVMKCSECGAEIPGPVMDPAQMNKPAAVIMEEMSQFKCPKCGKHPEMQKVGPSAPPPLTR